MALTNSQYDSIMRDYSDIQFRNVQDSARLKEHIYSLDPRLAEIDSQVASESIAASMEMAKGNLKAMDELKIKINKLKSEKEAIIVKLGFTLEDLQPKYRCKDCKDTGYVNGKRCHCFRQASIDKVYSQSNLGEILELENFSTFNIDYYSKTEVDEDNISSYSCAMNAYNQCKSFCDNFDGKNNLLLCGQPGIGKTFLTHCIAKELLDQSHSVVYLTADELIKVFEQETFERDETMKESSDTIFSSEVLIIDDLGTEFVNSFTSSRLFTCINERLLRGNSTIISTNLSLGDLLETYSERTFSRISQFQILKLFGHDIRIIKRQQGVN